MAAWLLLSLPLRLAAQQPTQVPADTSLRGLRALYVESPTLIRTLVELPRDFDSTVAYPLVIGLHGFGGRPGEFMSLAPEFAQNDIIFAAPQAPYALLIGDSTIGYDWSFRATGDSDLIGIAADLSSEYIVGVALELSRIYRVTDTYALGFSQGGRFAYRTAIEYPKLFAGIIAFGAGFRVDWFTQEALAAARDLRVFIGHGLSDEAVSVTASERARDALRSAGFDVTYRTFEGGHWVPRAVLVEVVRWIER